MSIIAPLPKRVVAIVQDESNYPIDLYSQKHVTIDKERLVAKTCMENSDYGYLMAMIKQSVFYTYLGFRNVYTLVLLFRSILDYAPNSSTRLAVRSWFLHALQNQENYYYGKDKKNGNTEMIQQRRSVLMAMIKGILNDRLIDKADCATYFTGDTLEILNIIPCKDRFQRRCQRLENVSLMKQQEKALVSETYSSYKTNKIAHHYILATMEVDNEDHDIAIIPLGKVNEFEKLFRSYLCGDDKMDGIVLMNIMLDLFMDEVRYNYEFWIELIKRCSNLVKSSTPSSDTGYTSPSSQDKEPLYHNEPVPIILANLFWIKLKDFNSRTESYTMPLVTELCAFNYSLAFLCKDDLVSLDAFLMQCASAELMGQIKGMVMTMCSIGAFGQAIWILQEYDLEVPTDIIFSKWLLDMMATYLVFWRATKESTDTHQIDHSTTSTNNSTQSTASTNNVARYTRPTNDITQSTTTKNHQPTSRSPLWQVTAPDDDTENNSGMDDDHQKETITTETTATAQHTKSVDTNYSCASPHFFYKRLKIILGQHSLIQLLDQFLAPYMLQIGGPQMADSPTIMNTIFDALELALDDDRAFVVDFFTRCIFPVLAYGPVTRVCDSLKRLTNDERLKIYLLWCYLDENMTPRAHRENIMMDLWTLINNAGIEETIRQENLVAILPSVALKLPIDVADKLLDHVESLRNRSGVVGAELESIHTVAKILYQPDQSLALDALAGLLAYRLAAFDVEQPMTVTNITMLPPRIDSLRQFAYYFFNNDHPASEDFYQYLGTCQQHSPTTVLPTVVLLRFMCSEYISRYQSPVPTSSSPLLPPPGSSRKRKTDFLPPNKRQCIL